MRVALADNRLDQLPVILLLFRVAGQVQAEDSTVLEFVGVANRRIGLTFIDQLPKQSAPGIIPEDGR